MQARGLEEVLAGVYTAFRCLRPQDSPSRGDVETWDHPSHARSNADYRSTKALLAQDEGLDRRGAPSEGPDDDESRCVPEYPRDQTPYGHRHLLGELVCVEHAWNFRSAIGHNREQWLTLEVSWPYGSTGKVDFETWRLCLQFLARLILKSKCLVSVVSKRHLTANLRVVKGKWLRAGGFEIIIEQFACATGGTGIDTSSTEEK